MLTNGLVSSFTGRLILVGIWAVAGLIGTTVLTLAVMARKGLPLTTQTNRLTGIREHGVLRWWLTLAAFFVAPQVLLLISITGTHYVLMLLGWVGANLWVLIVAAVGAAIVTAFAWLIRSDRLRDRQTHDQLAALPETVAVPAVAAQPAVGWSLDYDGQWDQR